MEYLIGLILSLAVAVLRRLLALTASVPLSNGADRDRLLLYIVRCDGSFWAHPDH